MTPILDEEDDEYLNVGELLLNGTPLSQRLYISEEDDSR